MPIKAVDLTRTKRFISQYDDASEEGKATVWLLGTLSSRDVGRIRDSVTSIKLNTAEGSDPNEVETHIERTKMNFEAVRVGLKGWENFIGPDGNSIPFKTIKRDVGGTRRDVVADELLDMIPLDVVNELADEILQGNLLSEEEAGNSPVPSTDA